MFRTLKVFFYFLFFYFLSRAFYKEVFFTRSYPPEVKKLVLKKLMDKFEKIPNHIVVFKTSGNKSLVFFLLGIDIQISMRNNKLNGKC